MNAQFKDALDRLKGVEIVQISKYIDEDREGNTYPTICVSSFRDNEWWSEDEIVYTDEEERDADFEEAYDEYENVEQN